MNDNTKVNRVVILNNPIYTDIMDIDLYCGEIKAQAGILQTEAFIKENTCTIYELYRTILREFSNQKLTGCVILPEELGIAFLYHNLVIEYRHTNFSLNQPLYCYLFNYFVNKDQKFDHFINQEENKGILEQYRLLQKKGEEKQKRMIKNK